MLEVHFTYLTDAKPANTLYDQNLEETIIIDIGGAIKLKNIKDL